MKVPVVARLEAAASRRLRRRLARQTTRHPELGLEKIGTAYGGWVIPTTLIRDDWVIYDAGVGEDASFARGLIERYGVTVHAFDPTPRAITFAAAQSAQEPRFRFQAQGLWSEDTTLRFWAPRDPTHVSHSVVNLQDTDEFFEGQVRSVPSLMAQLGHTRIDLLKLDIEGAEHRVLASMLDAGIRPTVIATEIDRPVSPVRFWRTVRRIRGEGYVLVAVDDWNLTFVRAEAVRQARAAAQASMGSPGARPRITFGIIVLNGEPFTRHVLRSLYPFAHQIIVVEGAAPGSRNIATADGHSSDGTLDVLKRFQREEDPDGKLTIVTAEDEGHPDGFWPGEKHEQSRAYAARATGDYLWQVDIDEFYRAEEMEQVVAMLAADPGITAVTFKQITFWGGLDYWVDGNYLRRGATYYHRLFRWGPGYEYSTHRPPTVLDPAGRDLRTLHWIDGETLARRGIRLYHYSLLLPKQVIEKCDYYANAPWAKRSGALDWAHNSWLELNQPFRVHNVYDHPSWLERYHGRHPTEVVRMVQELEASGDPSALRPTDDIERLLRSPRYVIAREIAKAREVAGRRLPGGLPRLARLPRRAVRLPRRAVRRLLRALRA